MEGVKFKVLLTKVEALCLNGAQKKEKEKDNDYSTRVYTIAALKID